MTDQQQLSATFFLEEDMEVGRTVPFGRGHAYVHSARCPGKERPNEDAAALIPVDGGRGVLAVADGLGGQPGADQASNITVHTLSTSLERATQEDGRLRDAILDGIERANVEVASLGVGAGTTLAVAEFDGDVVRPYHVGDSTILLAGQRGLVKLFTISHSPTSYAIESGLMNEEEALQHADRHLVSNMVGSSEMRIELGSPVVMAPHDTLLLASDGLTDNLRVEEILRRIRGGSIEESGAALADLANARMASILEGVDPAKPDDLTFILYRQG